MQCGAVCCSVLQCVAVCCSVSQYVAVCCSVLQCVAVCCSVLQCVAVPKDQPPAAYRSISKRNTCRSLFIRVGLFLYVSRSLFINIGLLSYTKRSCMKRDLYIYMNHLLHADLFQNEKRPVTEI